VGQRTGTVPIVRGEAESEFYLEPQESNALTFTAMDRSTMNPILPRTKKNAVFAHFELTAASKDVRVSRIGVRISNLLPGQVTNVRLRMLPGGTQVGPLLSTLPIVKGLPNVVFKNLTLIIPAKKSISFDLTGDLSFQAAKDRWSDGTPLQHEVMVPALLPYNDPEQWIDAFSLTPGKDRVRVFGGFSIPLRFQDK
jgi:hypothetical protein